MLVTLQTSGGEFIGRARLPCRPAPGDGVTIDGVRWWVRYVRFDPIPPPDADWEVVAVVRDRPQRRPKIPPE